MSCFVCRYVPAAGLKAFLQKFQKMPALQLRKKKENAKKAPAAKLYQIIVQGRGNVNLLAKRCAGQRAKMKITGAKSVNFFHFI